MDQLARHRIEAESECHISSKHRILNVRLILLRVLSNQMLGDLSFKIDFVFMYILVSAVDFVLGLEDNLLESDLSFYRVGPGIELK